MQRGLKKQLASNKTGELLTVKLVEITPITPEGHRTGVLRIIGHGEKLMKKTTSGGNLVLEQLGRGRAAYFNEFAYLMSTLQSCAWWKLDNLAVADYLSTSHTDADHEKYNQKLSAVLEIKGTDVKIGVWNVSKTTWLQPGTIMTIRKRLFESSAYTTATALSEQEFGERVSHLLSDPERYNTLHKPVCMADARRIRERGLHHDLFEQQQQVVYNACTKILSVVCGPPGTGKTVGIAHAVSEIMRDIIQQGYTETFHVFVTAANVQPIRTLLEKIASLTSDLKDLVLCEIVSRKCRLYNGVSLEEVPFTFGHKKTSGMPNFCIVGMQRGRFSNYDFMYDVEANPEAVSSHDYVNAKFQLVPPPVFQMGVIDEGSQLLCQDFPPILNRLHTRGRLVVAGDPLQLQPFATRKARISPAFIDRVGLPLHDSLLLCLLRRRVASHTVSLAANPTSRFYKEVATFAVLDKADCKVAMKESYVTKLTTCLRSHPDVASLTQGLYEEHVTAQPAACFDRWLRHKPAPLPPPATEEEREVTFTCVLTADDDDEEQAAVGNATSCEMELIPSMFRPLFKDGSMLGGQTVGQERLFGGLLVIELDMDAAGMMSQRAYTEMTSALALSMIDALQRNFRTKEDQSPSALLLYTATPVDVPTRCRMQEGRELRVGTPESLQGQSADVVVVTTGLPTQGTRDRYFCNITEMNVAFSRALHLQVLIVPKVLHLSEDALQDKDTSGGLTHIDAFRHHAKATTVRFVVSASLSEGVSVANSKRHTYPQRPQEDFVHDETHLPAGRPQPQSFKTDMQFRQPSSPEEARGGKGGGQFSKGRKGEKGDSGGKGSKGNKGGKGEKGAQQPHNDGEDGSSGSKGKGKGGRGGGAKQGGKGKSRQADTWGSFLGEDAAEGGERLGPPKPPAAMTSWRANNAAEGTATGNEDTPQPGKGSRRGKSAKGGGGGGRGGGKGGKKRTQQEDPEGSA